MTDHARRRSAQPHGESTSTRSRRFLLSSGVAQLPSAVLSFRTRSRPGIAGPDERAASAVESSGVAQPPPAVPLRRFVVSSLRGSVSPSRLLPFRTTHGALLESGRHPSRRRIRPIPLKGPRAGRALAAIRNFRHVFRTVPRFRESAPEATWPAPQHRTAQILGLC